MGRSRHGVLRLALTSFGGALVTSCAMAALVWWRGAPMAARIAVAIAGLVALLTMYLPIPALRKGVRLEQWDEGELRRVRAVLGRPWANVLMVLLFAGMLLFFLGMPEGHFPPYYWMCFVLVQSLGGVRNALREPRESVPATLRIDELKPIQSEHWGEPVR